MSVRAQMDTVDVGDEHSGSNGHNGGAKQAFGLDLRQWRRETSNRVQINMVKMGNKRSGRNQDGGSGRRAIALKWTQWRQEVSIQA